MKKEKEDFYIENGKYVFTEHFHIKRGSCCGSGCRNCPYEPKHKRNNTITQPQYDIRNINKKGEGPET